MLFSNLLAALTLAVSASAAAVANAGAEPSIHYTDLEKRERVVQCCVRQVCYPAFQSINCPCTSRKTMGCPEPVSLL